MDALDGFTVRFGLLCKPLHHGGFSAARAALDEVHPDAGFFAESFKIAFESCRCGRTEEEIGRSGFHTKHLAFALEYAKVRGIDTFQENSLSRLRDSPLWEGTFDVAASYKSLPL